MTRTKRHLNLCDSINEYLFLSASLIDSIDERIDLVDFDYAKFARPVSAGTSAVRQTETQQAAKRQPVMIDIDSWTSRRRMTPSNFATAIRECAKCGSVGKRAVEIAENPQVLVVTDVCASAEDAEYVRKIMSCIDIQPSGIYMTSLVKCSEVSDVGKGADNCFGFFESEVGLVSPAIIVAFGPVVSGKLSSFKNGLLNRIPFCSVAYMPSEIKKKQDVKNAFWAELKKISTYLSAFGQTMRKY